jgi:hypothetical protein
MIASGLSIAKAKLLFYAVYAFGPSWGYTIPGTDCSATPNCVQTVGNASVFVQKLGQFSDLSNAAELKAMEATIELAESKGGLSLDDLIEVADKAHPKQALLDSPPNGGVTK